MLAPGLLVVHDTSRGGEDDVAELTGRQQLDDPLLEVGKADVVPGGDDTSLVDTSVQLDDNFARAVVVNDLELVDVTWNKLVSLDSKESTIEKQKCSLPDEPWHNE